MFPLNPVVRRAPFIGGETLPVYEYRGEYWVAGTPGSRYAVVVTNRRDDRLLAVMSVDGINGECDETAGQSGCADARDEPRRARSVLCRQHGFERLSDTPDEIIRIRYDRHAALVARGIVPGRPLPIAPNAFPDSGGPRFVPDPPGR